MEPNLPNDCYACNRTCINSEAAAFRTRPRRYFQHLHRPSVLSFSSSRRQLRRAESAAFCFAVSSRRYHPINRTCITRAWPIMKRARMRNVCFVRIIGWHCYTLDAIPCWILPSVKTAQIADYLQVLDCHLLWRTWIICSVTYNVRTLIYRERFP